MSLLSRCKWLATSDPVLAVLSTFAWVFLFFAAALLFILTERAGVHPAEAIGSLDALAFSSAIAYLGSTAVVGRRRVAIVMSMVVVPLLFGQRDTHLIVAHHALADQQLAYP